MFPPRFVLATLRHVDVSDVIRAGEQRLIAEALLSKRDANAAGGYESFHVGPEFFAVSRPLHTG